MNNNKLTYKNYTALIEFDAQDKLLFGRIAGIEDIITFHGMSVDELIAAFEEAVDDYLQTCEKMGQVPNTPYLPDTVFADDALKRENSELRLLVQKYKYAESQTAQFAKQD